MSKNDNATELTDDIEVIGPGQMLAEARKSAGLSQDDVAKKLNFRTSLVADIENETFDKSLPDTYNRGYLRNYAKLVKISQEDILNSYEMLGIAKTQGAEMQSFSRATEKQAHNSYLMWATYLIIALVIGSSAMWWLQGNQGKLGLSTLTTSSSENEQATVAEINASSNEQDLANEIGDDANNSLVKTTVGSFDEENDTEQSDIEDNSSPIEALESRTSGQVNIEALEDQVATTELLNSAVSENPSLESASLDNTALGLATSDIQTEAKVSNAVFKFSGDCWVNIYDATGERIAWGVKKSDYEMTINGVAPLTITLGKPELVSVRFNGESVDMSQFNQGNIAKFSLPLE